MSRAMLKSKLFTPGPGEGIESLTWNHREIQLGRVEYGRVGPACRLVQNSSNDEIAQRARVRGPSTAQHKAMALIELRRSALCLLIELIVVTGALIDSL